MDKLEQVLKSFGILLLGAALIEALVLRFVLKRAYDWRSSLASLGTVLGRAFTDVVPLAVAMPGAYWLYEHRVLEQERLGAWSFLILFLGLEFVYYWWHRISHRSRWFWTHHAVHHSPNDFNLSAAYRLGWAHRVHHAANLEYLDANFGGVLMIFDRLFGTYRGERDDVKIRYGLVKPLLSNNPFKIAFHQYGPWFSDLRSARSLREVIGYTLGPPGWRPDGLGQTTEDLRRLAAAPLVPMVAGESEPVLSPEA